MKNEENLTSALGYVCVCVCILYKYSTIFKSKGRR